MRAKSILRGSRYLFLSVGVVMLSYVGYAVIDARLYQAAETRRLQRAIIEPKPKLVSDTRTSSSPGSAAAALANHEKAVQPAMDGSKSSSVGRIEISTVGVAVMILEGTDEATLRRGVGHVSGTALPGQKGNVGIAGHRDTFFRGLRDVRKDMEISISTFKESYRYRVDSTEVVEPQDAEVLYESDEPTLTLITCYPFHFVGSAPRRFIVHAHKIP